MQGRIGPRTVEPYSLRYSLTGQHEGSSVLGVRDG